MDINQPSMSDLFQQLGLKSDDESIEQFIEKHKGLNKTTYLHKADYWNDAQRTFLKEALVEDALWAEVIDELNVRLH
ncbi:DUF2789 domain-containing protein [Alteromonas oceanisediminis]|uniref:DUF2789 domain-containing protein n=1 Tax=Alteromonas oceanisediminis TaxID=2836180 RepID=UPI001BD933D3|nr:DUF2789 domain-containing protein [Alteromonas oceanisediminis]MBT0585257.1 DUF2789 family protein [Alteromonas oceanisediminis]